MKRLPLIRRGAGAVDFRSGYVLIDGMAYPRRYAAAWKVEEQDESYFVVDGLGQRLAYLHFENESVRQGIMKRLSKDDAWKLARAITRIPALMQRD